MTIYLNLRLNVIDRRFLDGLDALTCLVFFFLFKRPTCSSGPNLVGASGPPGAFTFHKGLLKDWLFPIASLPLCLELLASRRQ
jgi:hypothetical protein